MNRPNDAETARLLREIQRLQHKADRAAQEGRVVQAMRLQNQIAVKTDRIDRQIAR